MSMCYHLSLTPSPAKLEARFGARFDDTATAGGRMRLPLYHASAFTLPALPAICNDEPDAIRFLHWGLIPHWVRDRAQAERIRKRTFNARAETVFEKPAFREGIRAKRCLVPADGFFEWRDVDGTKFPYYIHLDGNALFAFAGIWDHWVDPKKWTKIATCAILTTRANPLLAWVHNTKQRMPVLLGKKDEKRWLDRSLPQDAVRALLEPYDAEVMRAYTVSKRLGKTGARPHGPEVLEPYEYPELKFVQRTLELS